MHLSGKSKKYWPIEPGTGNVNTWFSGRDFQCMKALGKMKVIWHMHPDYFNYT
jgi:hypothetical protein